MKIGIYNGLSLAAVTLAAIIFAGFQPVQAQANNFDAFFEKNSSEPRTLERRGNQARDQRRNAPRIASPDFNGSDYRRHIGDLAANSDLKELEQRGYDARRARPGYQIRDEYDLTPNERRDLQQRGRQAQIKRGRRNGFRPVTADIIAGTRYYQTQAEYRDNGYAGAGRAPVRGQGAKNMKRTNRVKNNPRTGYAATSWRNRISAADMGAEAFGGHGTGIGEYGVDMTLGQAQTFANGDDPVIAAGRATERFGQNLNGAAHGIGQSIRDPRRIPGNVDHAATGVVQTGLGAARYAGETAIKTTYDGMRFVSDPQYASRQVDHGAKQAVKTVGNIGKSTCKGFSTLLGLNKRKCR